MAKILFCWELGEGLGHLFPNLPLINRLAERGHEVWFAMNDLSRAESVFPGCRVSYLQAPGIRSGNQGKRMSEARTYAQILQHSGYDHVSVLTGLVKGWQELFRLVRPDLLLSDYSPTALLACRGLDLKKVVIGAPFFVPPNTSPLPNLRPLLKNEPGALARDEDRVLHNINTVLSAWQTPPLARLADLFQADATILRTFAEFDFYPREPEVRYWGSGPTDTGEVPVWPVGQGKRIFAYLKSFETLHVLLRFLKERHLPTIVFVDGLSEALRQEFSSPSLAFALRPQNMKKVCAACDVAITNGGQGTVDFLLAGKPSLLLPLNLAQYLNAEQIVRLGAGLSAPQLRPDGMASKLSLLLSAPQFTEAARAFAARYPDFDAEHQAREITAMLEKMLPV